MLFGHDGKYRLRVLEKLIMFITNTTPLQATANLNIILIDSITSEQR